MKIHDHPQGSDEWFACRAGRATASEFAAVLAKGQGKTRAKYQRRVIAERLMGKSVETFENDHTIRGNEQQPLAGMSYEMLTGNVVQQVGFYEHDSLMAGCSPDGIVLGERKGVEIKCVIPTVQVETILRGGYPPEHQAQVQGSLWITGYKEWDFVSHSPELPEHLRTYIFTVQRDEDYIKNLESEVRRFLVEIDLMLAALNKLGERKAA